MIYYWVAVNRNCKLAGGVRNIIKSETNKEEVLKKDYYEDYNKYPGDHFVLFNTLRKAQEYADKLSEES
ncbi:peptidase M16 domain-containing protein (plasmid) [Ruminococcus albus 7 = DSM 20455]|jgi:hypothetical protein|uniref:Peptidase M16 domain-containing protein n=1 Tax=Ruminococcus albus (strain ATCC 27210 / DSM 20455 / JCM 14654 / NCDO 2250 / 7) TaxID=697329 RepID=E6UK18_RUMA7|nr:peptidase M16 domain-containing protein [Ruminococcus albus 7 = DSM 20455]